MQLKTAVKTKTELINRNYAGLSPNRPNTTNEGDSPGGPTGKIIKLAGGNFDMHSRVSDSRFEIIAVNYMLLGGSRGNAAKIMNCTTTEEALEYVDNDSFYPHICSRIKERGMEYVHHSINIEVVSFRWRRGSLPCRRS
jgi:cobalt-precorrin-5B (C1)-methyltransferase